MSELDKRDVGIGQERGKIGKERAKLGHERGGVRKDNRGI